MSNIDAIIVLVVLVGMFIGYKKGAIYSVLTLVGSFLIFLASFYLKGIVGSIIAGMIPINIPLGSLQGITAVNVLIYEGIGFAVCEIVLTLAFNLILHFTGVFNNFISNIKIIALPNKIFGAIFGAVEYFIFMFFALFVCSMIPTTSKYISESKMSTEILNNTPFLSGITKNYNESIKDIYALVDKYKDSTENIVPQLDSDILDVLLKYDIISIDTVKEMVNNKEIEIDNLDELIFKYEK